MRLEDERVETLLVIALVNLVHSKKISVAINAIEEAMSRDDISREDIFSLQDVVTSLYSELQE